MKEQSHFPRQYERRKFLQQLGAASLLALTQPEWRTNGFTCILPNDQNTDDEKYWEKIKSQFIVPRDLMMVNAANLCPSPASIVESVNQCTKQLGANVSFQYRATLNEKRNNALSMLADFLRVSKSEIAITRNTSESNAIVVNSFDFKPGEEIIIWDQNHPSASAAFEQRAKRYGFTVKKVSVPANPGSEDELFVPFEKAVTDKTKLIAFSHISNISGIALPVRRICLFARKKNILTLVDGAQSFGLIDMNLNETGCDFYTASTHKWLMGPLENGILFASNERQNQLWPNVIGAGWKEDATTLDQKIGVLGQRNDATAAALPAIIEFQNKIGRNNIEQRVIELNSYLKQQIQARIPKAKFISPIAPATSAGIVIIELPGKDSKEIYQKLFDKYGIACAATGGIRFSPHIYNTISDLDKIVRALESLAA